MEMDNLRFGSSQPPLFDLGEAEYGIAELFPAVWGAAEALTQSDAAIRKKALDYLANLRIARLSPLIAYLICTRLDDPDPDLRARVVEILADTLSADSDGKMPPEAVRQTIISHINRLRTRGIYSILSVLLRDAGLSMPVARILGSSSYAGLHLADIASSRKAPLEVRRTAIQILGEIGYVDAITALERILARLELRLAGQQSMPFAPPAGVDEIGLLPDLKKVLVILRSR